MTHLELENLASDYLEGELDAVRRRFPGLTSKNAPGTVITLCFSPS